MPSPLLPSWIEATHPLHLNVGICERIEREFDSQSIFLNIPYSGQYRNLETAILATVTAYGLKPRLARERSRMEIRLVKIFEMILACPYAITDLSYVRRMNMPLELGMLLATGKESFVMANRRYAALRFISDLNFCDVLYHEGRARRLIVGLSRWIEQTVPGKRYSTESLLKRYMKLRDIREDLGDDFGRLRSDELLTFLPVVEDEFGTPKG